MRLKTPATSGGSLLGTAISSPVAIVTNQYTHFAPVCNRVRILYVIEGHFLVHGSLDHCMHPYASTNHSV